MNDASARKPAVLRTAVALLSVQGLTWLSSLVAILVVPRFLGAARFGQFSVAFTLTRVVTLVSSSGTTSVVIRDSARSPGESANFFGQAVTGRLALWIVLAGALSLAAPLFSGDPLFRLILPLFLLAAGIGLVGEAASAGLQGNHALGRIAVIGGVIGILGQAASVAVLMAGGGVIGVAIVGLLFGLFSAAVAVLLFIQKCGIPTRWSIRETRALMAAGRPFLAWELALLIYGSIDYVLLALLTNDATVGVYSFAYRLASIPIFIPTIITSSLFASLAAAAKDDLPWFREALFRGAYIALLGATPIALGLVLVSPQAVHLLASGREFDGAIACLAIVALHIPFVAVDTVFGMALNALDRQGFMARLGWVLAVVNPALNLVAIPVSAMLWDNGAIGASIVTLITEVATFVVLSRQLAPMFAGQPWESAVARLAAASVAMSGAALFGLYVGGLFVAVGLGAAVYGISVLGLRLITADDVAQVRDAMRTGRTPLPQEP